MGPLSFGHAARDLSSQVHSPPLPLWLCSYLPPFSSYCRSFIGEQNEVAWVTEPTDVSALNPTLGSAAGHWAVIISSYSGLPWEKTSPHGGSKSWLLPLIPAPFPYFTNVAGPSAQGCPGILYSSAIQGAGWLCCSGSSFFRDDGVLKAQSSLVQRSPRGCPKGINTSPTTYHFVVPVSLSCGRFLFSLLRVDLQNHDINDSLGACGRC